MVPKPLRDEVWMTYRPGQEITKEPTPEYLDAMQAIGRRAERSCQQQMITTIRNGNLSAALKLAAGAISTRTSLPVLKNILIDAAGDRLRLAGTDLEVSIERTPVPR
jgi:hypothetical protein